MAQETLNERIKRLGLPMPSIELMMLWSAYESLLKHTGHPVSLEIKEHLELKNLIDRA